MFQKILYSIVTCWTLFIVLALPTEANFEQTLKHNWTFYNEQLITSSNGPGKQVDLPLEFNHITGNVSGYATFIKQIEVPNHGEYALFVPFVYSATAVYVNGELIQQMGNVADNEVLHESDMKSFIVHLPKGQTNYEIAIQVSSFQHLRGGFSKAPVLGTRNAMEDQYMRVRYGQIFTNGIIFVVGIMTVFIGLLRRGEREYFVFGLFALVIALRGIFSVPFLYHELPFDVSYNVATRMEYFTTNIAFMLYAIFIYVMYKKLFSTYILIGVVTILAGLATLAIFAPEVIYQQLFFKVFLLVVLFILYNIYVMIRALRRRMQLAKPLLLGILFVFIGLVLDYLSGMGIIYILPTANFMIALNVIFVLFAISQHYVMQLQLVTHLNTSLEQVVKQRTEELEAANIELVRLVHTDALTGSFNRHKFNEAIVEQFNRSVTEQVPLGLIMIDVDEFKLYNDFYGHVHGDELLQHIVKIMVRSLPEDTVLARYGGEEFAIILYGYSMEQVIHIGEKLVRDVELAQLEHLARYTSIVTISAGCAERVKDCLMTELDLIRLADDRLYQSKSSGRNKITTGL